MGTQDRKADIAVIGLGSMGLPICVSLAKSGIRVQGWNRTPRPFSEAQRVGAKIVPEIAQIDAPIVVSLLPDIPEFVDVLEHGLAETLKDGDLVVVMSTVAPNAVIDLSKRLSQQRVSTLDAPVSGGDVGAWEGRLSVMAGGSKQDFARCQELFAAISSRSELMGSLGSGQIAKACNQLVVGSTLSAIGEALLLARSYQVNVAQLLDVMMSGMAASRAMEIKYEKYISGNFVAGGKTETQLKDLRIVRTLATEVGLDLSLAEVVLALYASHCDAGCGELDHSSILLTTEGQTAVHGRSLP